MISCHNVKVTSFGSAACSYSAIQTPSQGTNSHLDRVEPRSSEKFTLGQCRNHGPLDLQANALPLDQRAPVMHKLMMLTVNKIQISIFKI